MVNNELYGEEMNKKGNNPKKEKTSRRKRPIYTSSGKKDLYVKILHGQKHVWVKVDNTKVDGDRLTGLIAEDLTNNPNKLGNEIIFNMAEIITSQEVEYICKVKNAKE